MALTVLCVPHSLDTGTWTVSAMSAAFWTEAGSYLRLIDSCITQLKAQGPSRTCTESKEEEEEEAFWTWKWSEVRVLWQVHTLTGHSRGVHSVAFSPDGKRVVS